MKAECAAESLVKNYHSLWRNFPEDCTLPKLKLTLYSPGQALKAPGVWGFQNFQTVGTLSWQWCQPYTPAASPEISLALTSVRDWVVDPRATVRPEGSHSLQYYTYTTESPLLYLPYLTSFSKHLNSKYLHIYRNTTAGYGKSCDCGMCCTVEESWFNCRQGQEVFLCYKMSWCHPRYREHFPWGTVDEEWSWLPTSVQCQGQEWVQLQLLSPIHHDVHKDKFTYSETCAYMYTVIFILIRCSVLYYIEYKRSVAPTGRRVSYDITFTKYAQELNNKKEKNVKNTLKYRVLILLGTYIFM